MEKINLSGIYCIENLINGKKYIGQAKNFCIRWNTHKYNLNSEENFGRKLKNSTSKYRGVSWDSKNKKWFSQFSYHREHYFLGRFIDEVSAAKAYDQKIFSLSGKKEFLNFPEEF
jgi:ABC-type lipoprotein release transport system permease subunit